MIKTGDRGGITTMLATASLVLSALVFWNSISNRTSDRIDVLENRVTTVDGEAKSNSQRLDHDESWIATLITAKMNAGRR